jgi:hypothetical protein
MADVAKFGEARKALLKALALMNQCSYLATNALAAAAVAAEILKHFRVPFEPAAGYLVLRGDNKAVPHAWLVTRDMPKGDGTTVPFAVTDITFVNAERAVTVLGQNVYFSDGAVLGTYFPGTDLPPGCSLITVPPGMPQPLNVLALQVEVGDLTRYLARPEARKTAETVRSVVDKACKPAEPGEAARAAAAAAAAASAGAAGGSGHATAGPYVAITDEDPLARPPA